jgi:hypothetical protein
MSFFGFTWQIKFSVAASQKQFLNIHYEKKIISDAPGR